MSQSSPRQFGLLEIEPGDPAAAQYAHGAQILESFGYSLTDPDVIRRVVAWGREQYRLTRRGVAQPQGRYVMAQPEPKGAVVYYMRVGDRVKIGWTTNLKSRLAALAPEELLAIERGGAGVEKDRHLQFESLHTVGEWFRYESHLVEHINWLVQVSAQ